MVLADGFVPDQFETVGSEVVFLLALVGSVGAAVEWIRRRVVKPMQEWLHDLNETKLQADQTDERLDKVVTALEGIQEQISPANGEGSLSARVNSVLSHQEELEESFKQHTASDEANFEAIAEWTSNFAHFKPIKLPTADEAIQD